MEITLPAGSTSVDLQAAIDNAASGDTIVISGDMPFTATVTVPSGKEITIQSDTGNNWVMSQSNANMWHFTVAGTLILQDITLDGMHSETVTGGGGVQVNNGSLTTNSGTVIKNCYSNNTNGGAVYLNNGKFIMNGGIIGSNAANYGGGIFMTGTSSSTMNSGTISGNKAGNGGGIFIAGTSSFTMNGGMISDNTSNNSGGGIFIMGNAVFTMNGGAISGNTAANGGGVFVTATATFTTTSGTISGNVANANGGGIDTSNTSYGNLSISSNTVFRCNRASAAYNPPEDAGTLYPNIQFARTTITDHPLNNFDINYTEGASIAVAYNVIYDANSGSGSYMSPDIEPGGTHTVLSSDETGISREKYTFAGWNTELDGSGTEYQPGESIILNCSTTLYAQWNVNLYSVTYDANGGTGSFVEKDIEYGSEYIVLSPLKTGIRRIMHILTSWNTRSDGTGTSYAHGDTFIINDDITLYAQWEPISVSKLKKMCSKPVTKCRTSIEGQKIWDDNDNIDDTRPDNVEILLLRDGEVYKRTIVNSTRDWAFAFCCLPVFKNSGNKYVYWIDEVDVPGYKKEIEGYNVINTLTP